MKFTQRTGWPRGTNRLYGELEKLKSSGRVILDLTVSNPTECGFEYDPRLLEPLRDARNLKYEPEPRGLLEAREAVAAYYAKKGARVEPDRIFLTSGTSEAYSFLLRLLAEPGDSALVPKPGYPLLDMLGDLNDVKLAPYRLNRANGWRVDAPALASSVAGAGRVAAIVTVNPNNPTGNFVTSAERSAILDAASRAGAAVIADEVFLDYAPRGARTVTFAEDGEALAFTLGGISKCAGLPQMKAAWMVISGPAGDRAEAARRLEMIADTYLSVGTPAQRALPFWLETAPSMASQILSRTEKNRASLQRAAAGSGTLRVIDSEGGWYALVEAPAEDETAALELLSGEGVLVQPGYFFDFEEGNILALSLLSPEAVFDEGIKRILRWSAAR